MCQESFDYPSPTPTPPPPTHTHTIILVYCPQLMCYASFDSLQRIQRYSLMDMILDGKTRVWWTNGQSSYQIFSLGKNKIGSYRLYTITAFCMYVCPYVCISLTCVHRKILFRVGLIFYIGVAPITQATHVCNKIVSFKGGHLM